MTLLATQIRSNRHDAKSMSDLEVTVEQSETAVVVHAAGSVDSNTAPQLEEPLLRAAENGAVQLDLAKVPYMSSAGLRVLLLAAKALQKRGERLRVINAPAQIYNVLNISGFTSFIDVSS